MTRILHVISGLGVGGAETVLTQVAPALAARGLPQHVVSLTGVGPLAGRLQDAGIPLTLLDLRRSFGRAAALPRLLQAVRGFRPEVIQGWMYHGDLAATVAHWGCGARRRRRLMWGVRCSDMDLARHARLIRLGAWLSTRPDVIVANSTAGARTHLAHGYRPRRLEVIPNGVDTCRFRPDPARRRELRAVLGIPDGRRVAIHVARVDPMKDHPGLLAAFSALPDVTLLLVGAGTEALAVPANVRALGRRDDVPALLAAADIVVSSSAFGEGFSNAVAEGMSAGLVPVVTDVGDARTIVGDSGQVVAPRDAAGLCAAVRELGALPAGDLVLQGLRARARISAEFSIGGVVERFAALYRDQPVQAGEETGEEAGEPARSPVEAPVVEAVFPNTPGCPRCPSPRSTPAALPSSASVMWGFRWQRPLPAPPAGCEAFRRRVGTGPATGSSGSTSTAGGSPSCGRAMTARVRSMRPTSPIRRCTSLPIRRTCGVRTSSS